ncbi:MAG: hypothetical protein AABZ12_04695 [Planctomycetota bacterium]
MPTKMNHQGVVSVNGQRFNGNGKFYFGIIDLGTGNSVWTNDGTNVGTLNRPNQPVTIGCVSGLYSVPLGDTVLANMTPVTVDVFSAADRALRIWFDDGTNGIHQLLPDHPLTTAPYAYRVADNASVGARFGGTGADGALNLVSGTTTLDLAGALFVIRNYTSISITGTGKLTFTNPNANGTIIILKSKGTVTLASSQVPMIDASNLGAMGGAAQASPGGNGNDGADGTGAFVLATHYGTQGLVGSIGLFGGAGGTGGAPITSMGTLNINGKLVPIACGAGGGGGARGDNSGRYGPGGGGGGSIVNAGADGSWTTSGQGGAGAGGRGGGALYIECAGAYNCSGTITVAAQNGGASATGSGGGGGGGGGTIVILYNTLIADTGIYTVTGGLGGTGGNSGGAGGNGASLVVQNTEFP